MWRTGAAIRPVGDDGALLPTRWLFQEVPEAKTVKNRVHVDLRPGPDADRDAIRAALTERGATFLHEGREGPHTWVTMTDPEGNEFCV